MGKRKPIHFHIFIQFTHGLPMYRVKKKQSTLDFPNDNFYF